jgi:hypothetical protein
MTQRAVAVTQVHWNSTKPFNLKFRSGNSAIALKFVDRDVWIVVKLEQSH